MRLTQSHHRHYSEFPVGTKVLVIAEGQDFRFFDRQTGTVVRNGGRYLSIIVEFDEPMHYVDGFVLREFGFEPMDLLILGEVENEQTVRPENEWPDFGRTGFGGLKATA